MLAVEHDFLIQIAWRPPKSEPDVLTYWVLSYSWASTLYAGYLRRTTITVD